MDRDSNGFITLTRKNSAHKLNNMEMDITEKEDKKTKKKKLPKFKSGSWKSVVLHRLKNWRINPHVEDFHFVKMENIIICFGKEKSTVFASGSKFTSHKIKNLSKKYDDVNVLIYSTDSMYTKISVDSYLKLCKINKVGIDIVLKGSYDGLDSVELMTDNIVIDNINELFRFINYHRQCIEGAYQVQCECFGFMEYDFKCKMMVWKTDNTVEVYKGDLNSFMKAYGLLLF